MLVLIYGYDYICVQAPNWISGQRISYVLCGYVRVTLQWKLSHRVYGSGTQPSWLSHLFLPPFIKTSLGYLHPLFKHKPCSAALFCDMLKCGTAAVCQHVCLSKKQIVNLVSRIKRYIGVCLLLGLNGAPWTHHEATRRDRDPEG